MKNIILSNDNTRGAHILDARSPRQLNLVQWHLLFVGPQCGTYLLSPLGTKNFEVAARVLENLWTPASHKYCM